MEKPRKYSGDCKYLANMIDFYEGQVIFIEYEGDEVYHVQTNGVACCGDEFVGTGWDLFKIDYNNRDHYCFNSNFWYDSYWHEKDGKPGFLWTTEKPKMDYKKPYEQIMEDYEEWGRYIASHKDFKLQEDLIKDMENLLNQLSKDNGLFSDFKIEEFKYEAAVRVSCLKNGVETGGWITWQNCD